MQNRFEMDLFFGKCNTVHSRIPKTIHRQISESCLTWKSLNPNAKLSILLSSRKGGLHVFSLLQLAPESRDLSQAEKKIAVL